jgi:hypothetical protein
MYVLMQIYPDLRSHGALRRARGQQGGMIGVATCSIGWFVLLRPSQGRDVLLLVAPCLSLLPNFVFQIQETAMAAGAPRWRRYFRDAPPQVGDEQVGGWSHAQLIRMDRFRARLLRAFKRGKESRQAATATYTPESGRQRA